ncbi:MAG: 30S ribosomal protein S4 [Atribacterota bacterium]|nr:30S ribosomal protein S4 [Candidatus Atribacteria bacterium]
MSRYTDAKCRLCRRQGVKLMLKGPRCLTSKCAFEKRPFVPGIHRTTRKRLSGYGVQLREKQKLRFIYGIGERQFQNYFEKANRIPGVTGDNFLSLLERRLDNVVFRMGIADSRSDARQMVLHGHFKVNEKAVNIPSYILFAGDSIEVSNRGKENKKIKEIIDEKAQLNPPSWLEVNPERLKATVVREPKREDIDYQIQEQLIVEFYSK